MTIAYLLNRGEGSLISGAVELTRRLNCLRVGDMKTGAK